ncbi:hypothetical protein SAY86_030314 [Trapa natans]|uniref:UDP-N-acetylmuramate dehydrogenase n=1 Tax=Trapa natans TaxID=22666 RepID=A0AAN7RIA8_TRANT|nr:hypothetical protein SAY86_030314 [Trapa natans]
MASHIGPATSPYPYPQLLHAPFGLPSLTLRARSNKPIASCPSCNLGYQRARVEQRNGLKFERGTKLLKDLSTWGIGGPCDYFVQVFDNTQLVAAVRFCQEKSIRFIVIGNGSNCLFDDEGFEGCVILNRIKFLERVRPGIYRVGSGFRFNLLGLKCSNEGFAGLEFAGGIPGTVGGAIYTNAGANGQETADVIDSVDILTTESKLKRLGRNELEFGYRKSPFQCMKDLAAIVGATFRLQRSGSARSRQLEHLERRRISQPIRERSAGSVFRNPHNAGVSAGKLIEDAGLKGMRVGGVIVSEVHANFLINTGGSSSQDMLHLIELVKGGVLMRFGIELEEEISYIHPRKSSQTL